MIRYGGGGGVICQGKESHRLHTREIYFDVGAVYTMCACISFCLPVVFHILCLVLVSSSVRLERDMIDISLKV